MTMHCVKAHYHCHCIWTFHTIKFVLTWPMVKSTEKSVTPVRLNWKGEAIDCPWRFAFVACLSTAVRDVTAKSDVTGTTQEAQTAEREWPRFGVSRLRLLSWGRLSPTSGMGDQINQDEVMGAQLLLADRGELLVKIVKWTLLKGWV